MAVNTPRKPGSRINRWAVLLLGAMLLPALSTRLHALQALPASIVAEAPAPADHREAIEQGRERITALMMEHAIPGMSVAVAIDGRIVWSEGFGYANLESRVPVTPLTRFRIGSVSKPVTAAALARLQEQGRLDWDAPVQRYVPAFPGKPWPITVRQVAGHLAGIRHYRDDEMLNNRRYRTVSEGIAIFQNDSLLYEPGTRYSYSSYGWNLLSGVVEGASGEEFLVYMNHAVFEPLGMRSIVAEHTDSIIEYRAGFYERAEDGRVLNAPYVDNSYKWAGGGFIANTEDLVRFGSAHLSGGFLKPATAQTLFTSQKTTSGEVTNYGIGWSSGMDSGSRAWVGHTGGSVGGRAVLLLYPEQRIVVAALANLGSAPLTPELAQQLAQPFLAAPAREER